MSNNSGSKRKADKDPIPLTPLSNDLLSSLDDPDLCDVTLVGSDGGRVPAVRAYLSARSDVLKRLLVGRFREANDEEVHMDYPSAVLKAMVHFCCTDNVPDLHMLHAEDDVESARSLVKLLIAADYYDLGSLKRKAERAITDFVNVKFREQGQCTCVALQELFGMDSLQEFRLSLLDTIRKYPETALLRGTRPGVTFLLSETLLELVEDDCLRPYAWVLFRAIKIWADVSASEGELTAEERVEFAKSCSSKLELRMISPKNLIGPVSESGLVDQAQIFKMLQKQANEKIVYLCGSGVDEINGIYVEQTINSRFEVVAEDDTERVTDTEMRRFDKRGQFKGENVVYTTLAYFNSFGDQIWIVVVPPKGASNLVLTSNVDLDIKKICEDNTMFYRGSRQNEVQANVVWEFPRDANLAPAPKLMSGWYLSDTQVINM
jgi:hypothetical protein